MEPIINPMFIYLVGFCEDLKLLLFFIFLLSLLPTITFMLMFVICVGCNDAENKEETEYYCKRTIVFSMISFVIWLLFAVIPSRQTALAMLATYYVTPDNIQIVQGNIVEFVRQIVDAVEVANNGK